MPIRAIIVDDEPLARERIRKLLEAEPEVEVIGECVNGREAVSAIRDSLPDLLFLDVQMPELDGFGVLKKIHAQKMPTVIFVTAYDQYALKAFEAHALDYLLKPFDRSRFHAALERAKSHIKKEKSEEINDRLLALLQDLKADSQAQSTFIKRLVVKSLGRVSFLRTEEIDWIEAAGNYLELHVGTESHLIRETMNSMASRLDPEKFLRIHRSKIVNIDRIKEIQSGGNGDYFVLLTNGAQLTSSRGYREKIDRLLK